MIQNKPANWQWFGLAALLGVISVATSAQEAIKQPAQPVDDVKVLIDRLTQIDREDIGYSASTSGSAFLPLGQSDARMMLLFQTPNESSGTLKSLVKLGNKALPKLLEHLSDKRPTRIKLSHSGIGGMFIVQDEEFTKKKNPEDFDPFAGEKEYTVMVGDLCYVAIGQIVNRNYTAVQYQPTNIILVTSVPKCKKLREDLFKEWGNLTSNKHRDSLARDLDSGNEDKRNGASLRLAYYYPADLEPLAIKQLARATYSKYSVEDVHNFLGRRLYPAKTAKERRALVEEFVTENGELARDSIRWALFDDLRFREFLENLEKKDKIDANPEEPPDRARECLIDVFGLPANVKSADRRLIEPLAKSAQCGFIETLRYDRGRKLDQALRDLLAKTDDAPIAWGCMDRLVGREYDNEIEAYLKRRLPELNERERKHLLEYKAKLGWTRLHAAVDLGVIEYVENAIKDKVPIEGRGRDGRTALHVAANDGKTEIASVLLDHGANVNAVDKRGKQTALHIAAYAGNAELVKVLLAKGADRDAKDEKNRTSLELAKENGHESVVKLLSR